MFEEEAEELIEESKRLNTTPRETVYKAIEFGYNKANEWHYVKDELPIITEKGRWLNLILKDRRVETFWWNFKSVPQKVIDNLKTDVIAWKEIVLPELPKKVE